MTKKEEMYVKLVNNEDAKFYTESCTKCTLSISCQTCIKKQRAKGTRK